MIFPGFSANPTGSIAVTNERLLDAHHQPAFKLLRSNRSIVSVSYEPTARSQNTTCYPLYYQYNVSCRLGHLGTVLTAGGISFSCRQFCSSFSLVFLFPSRLTYYYYGTCPAPADPVFLIAADGQGTPQRAALFSFVFFFPGLSDVAFHLM